MPPKGSKRSQNVSKGPPSKVKKVEEAPKISDPLLEAVLESIQQSSLPDTCKQMLLIMSPSSLTVPAEDRHESQKAVVRMVGEAIEQTHGRLMAEVETSKEEVDAAKVSHTGHEAIVVEAESKLTTAGEAVQSRETELGACRVESGNKQTSFDEAKDAQAKSDAEVDASKKEKDRYVSAHANSFQALFEGDLDGPVAAQHYKVLEPLVETLHLDESLHLALPSTCQKKPSDRGSFDVVIMEQLGKALQTRIAALSQQLEAAEAAAADRAASVQTAEQSLQAAKSAEQTAEQSFQDAKTAREQAYESLKCAKQAVADGIKELHTKEESHNEKLKNRTHFETWNMSSYTQLRDKSAAVHAPIEVTVAPESAAEVTTKEMVVDESAAQVTTKEMVVDEVNAPVTEAGA